MRRPSIARTMLVMGIRVSTETKARLKETFYLARALQPGLTWCGFMHQLMISQGVQARRRLRARGIDPETILNPSKPEQAPAPFDGLPERDSGGRY